MRILLTGATGFIGSHLLACLAPAHEVIVLARRPAPELESVAAGWIIQDLASGLDERPLPDRVDAVVHLAQSEHYKDFPDRAADIFAVNIRSTFELLDYARRAGASRFVFASTGGVYGHGHARLEESDPVSPIDFYLRSKYAGELLIESYEHLLDPVVLRLFFVYGGGQDRMLIPTLARRVRDGERVTIQGDPGLRINPIHVADAVRAFARALEHDGPGLFNVAGAESITLTGIVELLADLDGREVDLTHAGDQPPGDLVGNIERMRDRLGVEPGVKLRDGLREVLGALDAVKPTA